MADQGIQLLDRRTTLKKLGGVSKSKLYLDIAAKKLPAPVKIGSRSFWFENELDQAIKDLAAKRT